MRHVGTVLDAKPFHPTRKAVNHLRMLAVSNKIPRSRVTDVINLVGLGDVANAKPQDVLARAWGSGSGWPRRCSVTPAR